MKKIAFTLYVAWVIIMFPLIAYLEMNHDSITYSKDGQTTIALHSKVELKEVRNIFLK